MNSELNSELTLAEGKSAMLMFAQAMMEAQGPRPTYAEFGGVPHSNPWSQEEPQQQASLPASRPTRTSLSDDGDDSDCGALEQLMARTLELEKLMAGESASLPAPLTLPTLAPELLASIAARLSGEELTELTAVCKSLAAVCMDPLFDEPLWGRLLARDFPQDAASELRRRKARPAEGVGESGVGERSIRKVYLVCVEDEAELQANVGFGNC